MTERRSGIESQANDYAPGDDESRTLKTVHEKRKISIGGAFILAVSFGASTALGMLLYDHNFIAPEHSPVDTTVTETVTETPEVSTTTLPRKTIKVTKSVIPEPVTIIPEVSTTTLPRETFTFTVTKSVTVLIPEDTPEDNETTPEESTTTPEENETTVSNETEIPTPVTT